MPPGCRGGRCGPEGRRRGLPSARLGRRGRKASSCVQSSLTRAPRIEILIALTEIIIPSFPSLLPPSRPALQEGRSSKRKGRRSAASPRAGGCHPASACPRLSRGRPAPPARDWAASPGAAHPRGIARQIPAAPRTQAGGCGGWSGQSRRVRFPTPLCTAGTEPRTHTHTHTNTTLQPQRCSRPLLHTHTHTHTDIQPVPSLNAFSAALRRPPSILFPSLSLASLPSLPINPPPPPPAFCCLVFFSFLFFLFPPLRASLQSRHFDAISTRCGLKHKRSALPTPARLRAVGAQRSREGLRRFVSSGAGLLPSAQLQHPQPARSGDGGGRGGGRLEGGRAGERQAGRGGCEERRLGTSAHALCHRSPAAAGVSPLGPGG